jgi:pyruvate dehydrogenase E2 component (dihydrolipoamide acetyltransferase)
VLQASEGGSVSVGKQYFKVKASGTPPPVVVPMSATRLEGTPVAMPPNLPKDRIAARVPSSRFSTLAAATDKIVVSRNVLIGLCLTTFAFGIVTTLAADRIHARASEAPSQREPEPVVLQTTPIEPDLKAGPAAPAPAAQAAPAPAAKAAPAPAAQAAPAPAEATLPAAADAVVVQLPPASETTHRPTVRPSPPRAVRQVAAAPARTSPTTRKRASAVVGSAPTKAAPGDRPLTAPVKKKWVDPFEQ